MQRDPILITSYARTPMGGFQGILAGASAIDLGAAAIRAAIARSGASLDAIERAYMGCVLPAGLGQAPARQAALAAGLPLSVQATTVNKMCGSGMQALIMAAEALEAGAADIMVAGGMESMTNAPFLLPKHRAGARIGHDVVVDSMMRDGLEDAYDRGKPMGAFAEVSARQYGFTRDQQETFALESLSRAQAAIANGAFADELVSVTVSGRGGDVVVAEDEQPSKARPDRIASLKPAFASDGTITAATSASISDGAAALVLARASAADRLGLGRQAVVVTTAAHAHEPAAFTTAPVPAIRKVLDKAGWSVGDVDLFEVNEAFAVVAMIAQQELGLSRERLNVNGGATALGHPIGASGARIIATLAAALRARGGRRGVAALCIGGGEATAVAIELI
jgi:acetyl-CoA C-acetyltransferase